MPVYVKVYLNDLLIGEAKASNISDLADVSDYAVSGMTAESPFHEERRHRFNVSNHTRTQSVWSLVEKVAAMMKGG